MAKILVQQTEKAIIDRIVAKTYEDVLPPQDLLAGRLNVSRSVLREVVAKLEAYNILAVRPKTGTSIVAPSEWNVVNRDVIVCSLAAGVSPAEICAALDAACAEIKEFDNNASAK
jgi:DNA-binding FadR family transcriptional regulator